LPLEGTEGSLLLFNDEGRDTMYAQLSETIGANNGSICDQNGSLLFYANGCKVFNSNHEMMENGGDINPGDRHDAHCLFGNYPGTQNSIIIPVPNTEDQYYYIHKTWARNDMSEIEKSEILWTLISFESNPLGEVILKNTSLNSGSKTLSNLVFLLMGKNWQRCAQIQALIFGTLIGLLV